MLAVLLMLRVPQPIPAPTAAALWACLLQPMSGCLLLVQTQAQPLLSADMLCTGQILHRDRREYNHDGPQKRCALLSLRECCVQAELPGMHGIAHDSPFALSQTTQFLLPDTFVLWICGFIVDWKPIPLLCTVLNKSSQVDRVFSSWNSILEHLKLLH